MMGYSEEPPGGPDSGGGAGVVGALAMAGASIYDTAKSAKTAKENTNKTIAAQKAEAELAYQRSIEMWNMQNAYNSPSAQMQRFKAAGLNPHLIYGQGNAGNASSTPSYQPANLQYRYEAGRYGAGLMTILPTLMQVGSWMQDMRLKEAALLKTQESTQLTTLQQAKLQQLIDHLYEKNPRLLKEMDNRLSLFPYQFSVQQEQMHQADLKTQDMYQDFRYKYGEELWRDITAPGDGAFSPLGGSRALSLLSQEAKARIDRAKASWTEFDITNPQAIMQLVLSGIMGMAGQTLKARINPRSRVIHETEHQMSTGRINRRRRIYER